MHRAEELRPGGGSLRPPRGALLRTIPPPPPATPFQTLDDDGARLRARLQPQVAAGVPSAVTVVVSTPAAAPIATAPVTREITLCECEHEAGISRPPGGRGGASAASARRALFAAGRAWAPASAQPGDENPSRDDAAGRATRRRLSRPLPRLQPPTRASSSKVANESLPVSIAVASFASVLRGRASRDFGLCRISRPRARVRGRSRRRAGPVRRRELPDVAATARGGVRQVRREPAPGPGNWHALSLCRLRGSPREDGDGVGSISRGGGGSERARGGCPSRRRPTAFVRNRAEARAPHDRPRRGDGQCRDCSCSATGNRTERGSERPRSPVDPGSHLIEAQAPGKGAGRRP